MTVEAPTRDADALALRGRAKSIIRGRGGRLFYEDYEGASLATLAAAEPFPSALEHRWRRTLETRARRLGNRGLTLYVLFGPDAHFVYPDELPPGVQLPDHSLAEQFVGRFRDVAGCAFVDPTRNLIEARGGIDVYKANDTHWSAYGAFVAYRALIAALPPERRGQVVDSGEVSYRFRRSFGDMGALVEPEMVIETPVPEISGTGRVAPVLLHDRRGAAREAWVAYRCESGRGRAMIARDSFGTELAPFVNATFATVDWISSGHALPFEAIDACRPDVVIWEVAERRLPFPPRDHQPFGEFETLAFDAGAPVGRTGLAVVALRQDGNRQAALAAARQAVAEAPDEAILHFWLAQTLYEAGLFSEAEQAVGAAIRRNDSRPAFWHLSNVIQRHNGNAAASLAASLRAAAMVPDNALFVSHLGFNLLAAGRPEKAVAEMSRCREIVADSEDLCYWLARALLAVGDREGAMAQAVDCYLLQPDHAAIHALLADIRRGSESPSR